MENTGRPQNTGRRSTHSRGGSAAGGSRPWAQGQPRRGQGRRSLGGDSMEQTMKSRLTECGVSRNSLHEALAQQPSTGPTDGGSCLFVEFASALRLLGVRLSRQEDIFIRKRFGTGQLVRYVAYLEHFWPTGTIVPTMGHGSMAQTVLLTMEESSKFEMVMRNRALALAQESHPPKPPAMVLLEHFQAADSTKTAAVRTSQLREVVRGIGFDVSDELAKYIGSRYSFIMMPY